MSPSPNDRSTLLTTPTPIQPVVPGSLVFQKSQGPVDLNDYYNWWAYVPGASWKHPEGPGSDLSGRNRHPVTHVAYEDAEAYARWVGKELPPKRNGKLPRGVVWWARSSPGATSLHRTGG